MAITKKAARSAELRAQRRDIAARIRAVKDELEAIHRDADAGAHAEADSDLEATAIYADAAAAVMTRALDHASGQSTISRVHAAALPAFAAHLRWRAPTRDGYDAMHHVVDEMYLAMWRGRGY